MRKGLHLAGYAPAHGTLPGLEQLVLYPLGRKEAGLPRRTSAIIGDSAHEALASAAAAWEIAFKAAQCLAEKTALVSRNQVFERYGETDCSRRWRSQGSGHRLTTRSPSS